MSGMYSTTGFDFSRAQPAASRPARASAATAPWTDGLRTDRAHLHGARAPEEAERALRAPLGPGLRDEEGEAVVREVAVQHRGLEVREPARDEERRQRHGPAEQHAALERHR